MRNRPTQMLTAALLLAGLAPGQATSPDAPLRHDRPLSHDRPLRYDRDVRPLLAERCFPCHGPDAAERKGSLRLDLAEGPEGAHAERGDYSVLRPGSREESELWYRITTDDEVDAMPPTGGTLPPLGRDELALIGRWIDEGARYERFWAFETPVRPALPGAASGDPWGQHPVDRLVGERLEQEGLRPRPRADRRTLLRRLSLDLIGLPPTRAELHAFLADERGDAYERQVERLLADPRHGEHMARYWLDLVRFADTNGLHHDHYRDMSPYRDWVVRAFGQNLPYDRFVTEQLAGDLLPGANDEQRIASGFHRLHMIIDRGTMLPEESFTRNVKDRTVAFGTAFLGLTLECASCHDHKYDPLLQREFYELSAFFNNIDAQPETGGRSGPDFLRGVQPPYITFPSAEQYAGLARLDRERGRTEARIVELEAELGALPEDQRPAARAELLARERETLNRLRREKNDLRAAVPAAMVMRERAEVRPAHVLERGAYDQPGEEVQRDTPDFLPPLEPAGEVPTRLDLARWLVRDDHPLTARVAVNRLWQQLFGVGLVKTSEDFGAQGEWPSHQELLDLLARELVDSGWNLRAVLRLLVTSETYRQSSRSTPEAYRADPENRLLARGSRYRLDAEVIRDQILATSGLLDPSMYGRSFKAPQPAGLWKAVALPDSYPRVHQADPEPLIHRRSLYTFWKRALPPPQMTILDAPSRESCIARRERTNTPLQALLLLNEREYLLAARHLALELLRTGPREDPERLGWLHETITSRLPGDTARVELLGLARDLVTLYGEDTALAARLCEDVQLPPGAGPEELAAWTMVASTIYNLDGTRTRE